MEPQKKKKGDRVSTIIAVLAGLLIVVGIWMMADNWRSNNNATNAVVDTTTTSLSSAQTEAVDLLSNAGEIITENLQQTTPLETEETDTDKADTTENEGDVAVIKPLEVDAEADKTETEEIVVEEVEPVVVTPLAPEPTPALVEPEVVVPLVTAPVVPVAPVAPAAPVLDQGSSSADVLVEVTGFTGGGNRQITVTDSGFVNTRWLQPGSYTEVADVVVPGSQIGDRYLINFTITSSQEDGAFGILGVNSSTKY